MSGEPTKVPFDKSNPDPNQEPTESKTFPQPELPGQVELPEDDPRYVPKDQPVDQGD